MRILRLAFLLVLAVALFNRPAVASTIVVPNGNASVDGNTSDTLDDVNGLSFRFQELFGSGQFLSIGSPILIDQFAWRAQPGSGDISLSAANLDIYASTSARFTNTLGPPNSLMSSTFADNIGPDNTLVYHGPIALSGTGCAGPAPCAFNIVFNLQTPFLYNAVQGRLLLDFFVTDWNASAGSRVDAVSFNPPTFPNFGTNASVFGFLGDADGDFGPEGEVTQFRYTAVPEPATMTLMLSGFGAFAARRRRRATR